MVEDVSVKFKKEKMKENFDWLKKVQDQGTEERKKALKDLRYRLNQIAPDNADKIIGLVLEIISSENK
jgi:vacuolar-type H+-ATPase subunit H